jgi:small GTP-binding protein
MPTKSTITKVKCVLVGDSGAGKTSLVNRLFRNVFSEYEEATIGASFMSVEHDGVGIDLWDTAGQERYGALLPMYTRNAEIAFVVVPANCPDIDAKFEEWRRMVHHTSPDCYIINVVSQLDLYPDQAESYKALFWTSAKTGRGCEHILAKTISVAKGLAEREDKPVSQHPITLCPRASTRASRGEDACYGCGV